MRSKAIKTATLMVVCGCLLFAACSRQKPIETPVGSFDYSQTFMTSIENKADGIQSTTYTPQQGNIFLLVYLMPTAGTTVSLDVAQSYFQRGTSVVLEGETYGLYCLAYELVDSVSERMGLVFEVTDNGYADAAEQPALKLELPSTP